jgi:hypothetical protein
LAYYFPLKAAIVAAVVCIVDIFFKRSPIELDAVNEVNNESNIVEGVTIADPVVLSTGTPYRTELVAGTTIEPEN